MLNKYKRYEYKFRIAIIIDAFTHGLNAAKFRSVKITRCLCGIY